MTKAEAIRILDPETSREALAPYRLDCELMQAKVEEACRVAVEALQESEQLQNQLILRNDELLKMRDHVPKWVSVEERLPEDYVPVLTSDGHGNIHIFCHSKEMRFPFNIGPAHPRYFSVTHWMAFPEPPELPEVER